MSGNGWLFAAFLFLALFHIASAWQKPDIEYLESLQSPGSPYENLLNDVVCKNFSSGTQRENCLNTIFSESEQLLTDEDLAREWFNVQNDIQIEVRYYQALASWNYMTNMTDYNQQVTTDVSSLASGWTQQWLKHGRRFNYQAFTNESLMRMFEFLLPNLPSGSDNITSSVSERLSYVSNTMLNIYGKSKICRPKGAKYLPKADNFINDQKQECLALEPGIQNILSRSRDYDELLWAWKGWRDAVGPAIGNLYPEWVKFHNLFAVHGGHSDCGQSWRSSYGIENDGLEDMVDELYEEIKPLYALLHAFVRRRLVEQYPDRVNSTGPIPAHVFGNMWAQHWNNIYDIVKPYREVDEIDITEEMIRQQYNQTYMFQVAERFFVSLGLTPMPDNFWKYSMIVKPTDREVVCHGSATNFYKDEEVRIKMCTEVTMDYLHTVHHEMGHCEYYLQYSVQPAVFRIGANPAFHEAIGDTIGLSVVTPDYLNTIGLMDTIDRSKEIIINDLMKVALNKIAFLPFGLLIDKWRWEVFRGNIKENEYNDKWWEYRLKYQGIIPPVPRTNEDFDPGAKYHIPSGTPYIRYFLSFLLQFQFQRALCKEAGFSGPLHLCNIYQSKEAGAKLQKMLETGQSRPWTEILFDFTGQREIDTSAIKEYFAPLTNWLEKELDGDVGWQMEDNNDR